MNRLFLKKHIVSVSLILFLILYSLVVYVLKPSFLYNNDGSFRQFGIGTKKRSVINIMIVTIFLSIISYFSVTYYIHYPKLDI
jgi:hypothetical protein